MGDVTIICDRCHKTIEGWESPEATSGFYRSSHTGGIWDKYMKPNESVLCDDCMQHDARYQADYWPASTPISTDSAREETSGPYPFIENPSKFREP